MTNILGLFGKSSRAQGAISNWWIAAIGLLGLIALSDFITPLLKPPPTFCHWRDIRFPSCRCWACTFAMNGYEAKGLDEDAFGDKGNLSGLKTFDAFRKFTNTPLPMQEQGTSQEQALDNSTAHVLIL